MYDLLGDCIVDKETAAYKKVILKSQIEKENTADVQKSIDDNNETSGECVCVCVYVGYILKN